MALTPKPTLGSIQLIAFDLDGTLIEDTIFIWKTLHEHFGSDPGKRARAMQDHREGRITYADWFQTDLDLLSERGANRERILECFADLRLAPGATETLAELKARGFRLGLISGSLDVLLDHFFPDHPFDHVLINELRFDAQGRIDGGQPTPYDLAGKADGLRELARREGLSIDACAFIGDNVNDLEVMRAAGFAVGVHVKHPDVAQVADLVVEGEDLRQLLQVFT